jgi:NADPH:quinone reductase-like Zn-dependent oxidoreductase
MKMRVVEIADEFGLENLRVTERPRPKPGPGEVLVRLSRASVNFRDWLMVTGAYNPRQPLPLIPCSDATGVVEELGDGVERYEIGTRVCTTFFRDWIAGEPTSARLRTAVGGPYDGTLAEYYCAPVDAFVEVPDYLTDDEASTLPCAGVTAWNALVEQGGLRPGDTVLVQGTGGVSTFAMQFAVAGGARVIQTSSSDQKLDEIRDQYGVQDRINYVEVENWGRRAKQLTGGRGVDHVVEVGGAGTLEQSLRAVRPGGTVHVIGVLTGTTQSLSVIPILMRNVRVQGVIVGPREAFVKMNRALEHHELRPHVDRVFPLERTREAFEYLRSGEHRGKIVIDLT